MLNKPFILMQDFSKSAYKKKGSYGVLNILKMAVMDAAIL